MTARSGSAGFVGPAPVGDPRAAGQDCGVVTVRYFAAARAAAGTSEERHTAPTLNELLVALGHAHGPALEKVLGVASYLVDGVRCFDRDAALPADATVDVLPPFAGG
jgi:molybdopterin converting factor small subunit